MNRSLAACAAILVAGCVSPAIGPPTPLVGELEAILQPDGSDGLPPLVEWPAVPARLEVVGRSEPFWAERVKVWNDVAYVLTWAKENDVVIFDVSDPRAPERLSAISIERYPVQVAPDGDNIARHGLEILPYDDRTILAVARYHHGFGGTAAGPITFFDVTDPRTPVEIQEIVTSFSHVLEADRARHVLYSGGGWEIGQRGWIEIVDASDPDEFKVSPWPFPATAEDGTPIIAKSCMGLHVDPIRQRLYCAGSPSQALVIDISDPFAPRVLTAITYGGTAFHLRTALSILDGSVLVVSTDVDEGCLWFHDVAVSPPREISSLCFPERPRDDPIWSLVWPTMVQAPHRGLEAGAGSGFLVYVYRSVGLALIDARDPANPTFVHVTEAKEPMDVFEYRELVFATSWEEGLWVLEPR